MMPQRRPDPRTGVVDVGSAQHILGNEVVDLARQCALQAVGDMARHFLVEPYRLLSDRLVERDRALDRLLRGPGPADDLDQRDQVRRIEGVTDDATLRMQCSARLNVAHLDTGRARRDDHVRRQQLVELLVQLLLEVQPFGSVFLDQIHASQRGRQVAGEGKTRLRCAGRETQPLQRRQAAFTNLRSAASASGAMSVATTSSPFGEILRGPARADYASADDCDAANGFGRGHKNAPMRLSDFDVGDAGEIALSSEDSTFVCTVEVGDIERTGEVRCEQAVARDIQREADAFHQVGHHDLWRVLSGLRVDRRAVHGVAARRIAAVGPVEQTTTVIDFEIDRLGKAIEEDLDVAAVGRRLALRDLDPGAQDAPDSALSAPFCVQ
jgi:hypothetical protein